MDFMKVLNETVRDLKREVNLKVLKIPEIEQKVLDATSNEPWGPHGSALSEIAHATKKFTECQMIMNALWTRLTDTGPNWRHVYKALAVIEYLVANGSERAVDDILEHSFQISSISGFEYVEPNGKDVGINVRKKVETILALLNDKEKMQAVRNKAAANRDKYFGLSSTGITYKSSSASYDSSSYGGFGGSKEGESFKDSYKDSDQYGKESKWNHGDKDSINKSKESLASDNEGSKLKKGGTRHSRDQESLPTNFSKPLTKPGSIPFPKGQSAQSEHGEDDFDDFDPRGSSKVDSSNGSYNQVDLFGESLVGDLMDAPTSTPAETITLNNDVTPEVDLFADANFISASPQPTATTGPQDLFVDASFISAPPNAEAAAGSKNLFADTTFKLAPPQAAEATGSQTQGTTDLFSSQPAFPTAVPSNVDLFAASESDLPSVTKSPYPEPVNTKTFDPFAAIPLNNFEGSDLFGGFTSHTEPAKTKVSLSSTESSRNDVDQTSLTASKSAPKKGDFQVKSGIWADSLSRGLIDLNITAPKKTNLADIGIVGGLGDGSDEKEKGPSTSAYMGRAIGSGYGIGRSQGFPSSTSMGGSGSFSTLGQQQFGSFK